MTDFCLMQTYTQQIIVQPQHLDELNHVNNVIYIQWVQEISKAHWLSRVPEEVTSNYFWVVRSHHIDYKKEAFVGDELLGKTHVANFKGPFSERIVEFHKQDQLVAAAQSNWCMLSIEEKRPVRVPSELQKLFI